MIFKVVIDTCAYEEKGFNWQCSEFQALSELIQAGSVELFLCSMIEAECKRHIKDRIEDNASKIIAGIKNIAGAIGNSFQIDEKETLIQKGIDEFDLFHLQAKRITADGVCIEDIIRDYSAIQAPFEKNSKKANEFKDAISVYTIANAFENKENDVAICIISSDQGFKDAVKSHIESLRFLSVKHFIDFYNRYTKPEAQRIKNACQQEDLHDAICDTIDEGLQNLRITLYYDDFDPDEVDIIEIEAENYEFNVVSIENQRAVIDVRASVCIALDYSFTDENQSYYDREEQCYLFQTVITRSERHSTETGFSIEIDFSQCAAYEADEKDASDDAIIYDWSKATIESVENDEDEIILDDTTCTDREDIEVNGPFYEDENDREYATDTCPDCGCPISISNDGGNGFCINCASRH